MLSFLLKKTVPFLLTLTTGLVLGSLFGPARAPQVGTSHFGVRVYRAGGGCRHARPDLTPAWDNNSPVIITRKPSAEYTEQARRNHVTGVVELKMMLNSDGSVSDIETIKGLPDGLTEKATEAARRIEFVPARVYGRPTDTTQWVEYHFDGGDEGDAGY